MMEAQERCVTFHDIENNLMFDGISNHWVFEYPAALTIDPEDFEDEDEFSDEIENTLDRIFKLNPDMDEVCVITGYGYQDENGDDITRDDFERGQSVYNVTV